MNVSQNDQWFDDMVLELRLRNVRGEAIGDAVAAAQSHCHDSGETPNVAFGDAADYARSLEFADEDVEKTSPADWARVLGPVAVGLIGFDLTLGTVTAVLKGQDVVITWGALAGFGVLAAVVLIVARSLRLITTRPLGGILMVAGGFAAILAVKILWSAPAFSLSPIVAGVGAALFLVTSALLAKARGSIDDPVRDPLTHQDRYAPRSLWWERVFMGEWAFIVWAVVVSAVMWVLHTVVG